MGGGRVSLAVLANDADVTEQLAGGVDAGPPLRMLPVRSIALNPLNARPPGEDEDIAALAVTIAEHGVLQPLVVCSKATYLAAYPGQAKAKELRPAAVRWVALIGNRRLRGARLVDLAEIPVFVNDESSTSMYEVMLIENGQRRDLPPLLEAEAMREALAAEDGLSQRELARRIGRSAMYVTHRLALLRLVPELRELLMDGALTIEQARTLGDAPEDEQRAIAAAGPPYRRGVNGVYTPTRTSTRTIRVSTPADAAASIRERFAPDELAELVALLTGPSPATG